MPSITSEIALAGCFACSAAFAGAHYTVGTNKGRLSHVWIAGFVVFGVGLVLAWLALVNMAAALQALAFFVAGEKRLC